MNSVAVLAQAFAPGRAAYLHGMSTPQESMFWHMWVQFFTAATCSWLRGCVCSKAFLRQRALTVLQKYRSNPLQLSLAHCSTDLTHCS
jgi:hypothetical protein